MAGRRKQVLGSPSFASHLREINEAVRQRQRIFGVGSLPLAMDPCCYYRQNMMAGRRNRVLGPPSFASHLREINEAVRQRQRLFGAGSLPLVMDPPRSPQIDDETLTPLEMQHQLLEIMAICTYFQAPSDAERQMGPFPPPGPVA